MSEEVGRDIGNSIGRFIEMDKHASQSDQAKFMRIRVDLPIDKPLRRGGNIVGLEGEKFWVQLNMRGYRPSVIFVGGWVTMISILMPP